MGLDHRQASMTVPQQSSMVRGSAMVETMEVGAAVRLPANKKTRMMPPLSTFEIYPGEGCGGELAKSWIFNHFSITA